MNRILESRQMVGMSEQEQAKKAIAHVLCYLRDNWDAGYHLGLGTQSFALLTECYSNLAGEDLGEFRLRMAPAPRRKGEQAATEVAREVRSAFSDYQIEVDRNGHANYPTAELVERLAAILSPKVETTNER